MLAFIMSVSWTLFITFHLSFVLHRLCFHLVIFGLLQIFMLAFVVSVSLSLFSYFCFALCREVSINFTLVRCLFYVSLRCVCVTEVVVNFRLSCVLSCLCVCV